MTKKINDCLHIDFGIKNLYHRMIFTACALVAKRYDAILIKGMSFSLMKNSILNTLSKSLEDSRKQNLKLDLLVEVYSEIKMNNTTNQEALDNFILWISEISVYGCSKTIFSSVRTQPQIFNKQQSVKNKTIIFFIMNTSKINNQIINKTVLQLAQGYFLQLPTMHAPSDLDASQGYSRNTHTNLYHQ